MLTQGWFQRLCQGLDTPGGHMVACFILILFGAGMCKVGLVEEGKSIIGPAAGAIFFAMRGLSGGSVSRTQAPAPAETPGTSTVTSVESTTVSAPATPKP